MALWHDPLDELIADLERAILPKSTTLETDYQADLIAIQLLVSATLWGSPEERARVKLDPRVKAYLASIDSRTEAAQRKPTNPVDRNGAD